MFKHIELIPGYVRDEVAYKQRNGTLIDDLVLVQTHTRHVMEMSCHESW